MLKSGGSIRWVDHADMAIDPMTKYGGNWEAMQRLMATAEYGIIKESARLAMRKEGDSTKDRDKPFFFKIFEKYTLEIFVEIALFFLFRGETCLNNIFI